MSQPTPNTCSIAPSFLRSTLLRLAWIRNSSLGRAAILTVLLTALCKVIGFVREQSVAAVFGINVDLDTFHIAFLLPTLITGVVLQSLAYSLVLTVTRIEATRGREFGLLAFREGMFWSALISLGFGIALALFGPFLLKLTYPALSPGVLNHASRLLWILIPYTTISGITCHWSGYLNSQGRYTATSLSAGVISLAILSGLWMFSEIPPVLTMVLGFTLGAVLDLLNLAWSLRSAGLPLLPRISRWGEMQSSIINATLPLMIGSMLHFGTEMVDQSMASAVGEGGISELKYGGRIVAMVIGVLMIPISQVLFPKLVRLVESQQWSELNRVIRQMKIVLLTISIPIMTSLILFSQPIVSWSFERGKFTPESSMQVAAVQVMYAFQLPFYLVSLLLARLTVALRLNRLILIGGALNLISNFAMNWILMKYFGVTGIALSTAIVYLFSAMFFGWVLRREIRRRMGSAEEL